MKGKYDFIKERRSQIPQETKDRVRKDFNLRDDIANAIRTTLVIQNKESINHAVIKIMKLIYQFNSDQNVQERDATEVDSSNTDGSKK